MQNRRTVLSFFALATSLAATGRALAKGEHRHHSGHDLLGKRLKINGKHEVGKAGKEAVLAEVKDEKVIAMSAGSYPVKRVKTNRKMADAGRGGVHLAAFPGVQMAQISDTYYGYCIDWGDYMDCYWYLASEVVVTEIWYDYVPV
jgi:hypothetical protein